MWMLYVLGAVVVLAVFVVLRGLIRPRPRVKEIAPPDVLQQELTRLYAEREQAEASEDEAAVTELTLQIRTREHWLRKSEGYDDSWRAYYEKSSGNLLDEWGKQGGTG